MKPIALLAALVALAMAQHWESERIDSVAGNISLGVGISREGRVHACYSGDTGHFWYAWYDTAWHHEEVTAGVSAWSFAVSPSGQAGLLGLSHAALYSRVLFERTDTGWNSSIIPAPTGPGYSLVYDTFGKPALTCYYGGNADYGSSAWYLDYVRRTDTGWVNVHLDSGGGYLYLDELSELQVNVRNNHAAVIYATDNTHFYGDALVAVQDDSGGWHKYVAAERNFPEMLVRAWTAAPFCSTGAAACYGVGPSQESLFCGWRFVTTSQVTRVALRVDSLDHEHLVYMTSDTLVYTWRSGATWAEEVVMDGGVAYFGGLVLDQSDNPIVAYLDTLGRPWIARRVVGVAERSASGLRAASSTTVVRGVLVLPTSSARREVSGVLLDVAGKRVLDLVPGPNNVSGLAPGVYFIREAKAQAVRKVVITR